MRQCDNVEEMWQCDNVEKMQQCGKCGESSGAKNHLSE